MGTAGKICLELSLLTRSPSPSLLRSSLKNCAIFLSLFGEKQVNFLGLTSKQGQKISLRKLCQSVANLYLLKFIFCHLVVSIGFQLIKFDHHLLRSIYPAPHSSAISLQKQSFLSWCFPNFVNNSPELNVKDCEKKICEK